jgi:hypothetical protein
MLLKPRCDGPLSNVAFDFNLRRYVKDLDTNGNGRVEWEEFQAHFSSEFKGGRRSNALKAAFDKLDKDGTDSLDDSEVNKHVVALMDAKDSTAEVFDWIDTDGDNELSFTEMVEYLWNQKGFKGEKGLKALRRRFIDNDASGHSYDKLYNRGLDRGEFKQFADKNPTAE